jgi:hypothetical protein
VVEIQHFNKKLDVQCMENVALYEYLPVVSENDQFYQNFASYAKK